METRNLSFNELPDAVAIIYDKVGRIEEMLKILQNPTIPDKPDKRYTLSEAAEYCRLAGPTFRVYLRKRKVTGIKLGKSWLFTQSDLDKFLDSYRSASSADIEAQSNLILRRAKR